MQSRSEGGPKREWHLYLQDMEEFAQRAISYCDGLSREEFEANRLVQDAVIRNIELIGEAGSRIPESIRAANSSIPWREIVAMRNQLIHGYLGVDLDVVWDVVQTELPELIKTLRAIRKPTLP